MEKQYILEKIKEISATDGKPPGRKKFENITGIKNYWYGKYWAKWGDALIEAGYSPNSLLKAYPKNELLVHYLNLVFELGKLPTDAEIRIKSTSDSTFPGYQTFRSAFGGKAEQLIALLEYAKACQTSEHIILMISDGIKNTPVKETEKSLKLNIGYVYLIKFGEYFKIGRSNDFDRRLREIKTKLPEEGELLHVIETDDPEGIEAYWHNRFKDMRAKGEWFKLSNNDVKVFIKRKFM